MKKVIALTIMAATVISVGAYTTFAAINAKGTATNTVTNGNIKITLSENYGSSSDLKSVIMPGSVIPKTMMVENVGSKDCYVKIKLADKFSDKSGKELTDEEMKDQLDYKFSQNDKWTIGNDGFAYYNQILKPSEKTEKLKTEIEISSDLSENVKDGSLNTSTKAYAVQSDNNPIPQGKTVVDISGWPKD